MSRLRASPSAQRALVFSYLRRLNPADRTRAVHRALRRHGVRYVPASMCECRKTRAVLANFDFLVSVPGGPRGYLQRLSLERDEHERAAQIARDLRYIKLKGSRDLMADLGLARDVIALDVRLLNLLKLVGVRVPSKVQTDEATYKQVQDALLRQVARPAGVNGVQLDRILFNNYYQIVSMMQTWRPNLKQAKAIANRPR
jgi:hypothetical protein